MDDILPCPLCKEKASIKLDGYTSELLRVQCEGCRLQSTDYGDEDDAINEWNKLSGMAQKIENYRKGIKTIIQYTASDYTRKWLTKLLKENEDE